MTVPVQAPYGSWKSPIPSESIAEGSTPLQAVRLEGDTLYWLEGRPAEAGRSVLMRRLADGTVEEITPSPYNVRTRVHEYGGGAFCVHEGDIYFSNFADNHLYVRNAAGEIRALTRDSQKRYADGVVHRELGLWIGVREDHTKSAIFAENTLVAMGLDGADERIIVSGSDFYSNPRISPDGTKLCWLTWNHPNMPWDETELWVGELAASGLLVSARKVAGGPNESIVEPVWSPSGELYFVSDKSNWWNLMRLDGSVAVPVHPLAAEFAGPSWVFGSSSYDFANPHTIMATYTQNGREYLAAIDVRTGALTPIDTPYTLFGSVHCADQRLAFLGASPTSFASVVLMNCDGSGQLVVKRASELSLDPRYLSVAQPIEFPTEGGNTAHALFYAPTNVEYTGMTGELPPLLVHVHGGPTGASTAALSLGNTQYWTSRGFAVVDVNYGGSTGYGREYRDRLKGHWGVVDVDDSVNAARYLVHQGLVDGHRLAIAGGSAGGYTTLAALAFRDVFHAGASHFGLSELEIFAGETHKFESRYMDSLLGPYPEAKDVYFRRSPINFTNALSCPIIFFQGLDDKIVPPNQAELMVNALRKKGVPVAYMAFAGEGHGFRMAQNIKRTLDAELYFYGKIFGFDLADAVEPVEIENL